MPDKEIFVEQIPEDDDEVHKITIIDNNLLITDDVDEQDNDH